MENNQNDLVDPIEDINHDSEVAVQEEKDNLEELDEEPVLPDNYDKEAEADQAREAHDEEDTDDPTFPMPEENYNPQKELDKTVESLTNF